MQILFGIALQPHQLTSTDLFRQATKKIQVPFHQATEKVQVLLHQVTQQIQVLFHQDTNLRLQATKQIQVLFHQDTNLRLQATKQIQVLLCHKPQGRTVQVWHQVMVEIGTHQTKDRYLHHQVHQMDETCDQHLHHLIPGKMRQLRICDGKQTFGHWIKYTESFAESNRKNHNFTSLDH